MTDPSSSRLATDARRWRRLAIIGWALLLLAFACGGVTEHLEQLFVERVKVSASGSRGVTNVTGGEIVVSDSKGNRVVITPTGIELVDPRGRRPIAPTPSVP